MDIPDFYTYLSEAGTSEKPVVFECFKIKAMKYETGDNLLLVKINPTFIRRDGSMFDDLLLLNRDPKETLFPIKKWPSKVYVLIPQIENVHEKEEIMGNECLNIAWAELYRYEDDAWHEAYSGADWR
jgi:hypothetical protein